MILEISFTKQIIALEINRRQGMGLLG